MLNQAHIVFALLKILNALKTFSSFPIVRSKKKQSSIFREKRNRVHGGNRLRNR